MLNVKQADIEWIRFQLERDHGLVLTEWQVWAAIFQDAGRNRHVAEAIVRELSRDTMAVMRFARTFDSFRKSLPRVVHAKPDRSSLVLAATVGLAIGLIVGSFV